MPDWRNLNEHARAARQPTQTRAERDPSSHRLYCFVGIRLLGTRRSASRTGRLAAASRTGRYRVQKQKTSTKSTKNQQVLLRGTSWYFELRVPAPAAALLVALSGARSLFPRPGVWGCAALWSLVSGLSAIWWPRPSSPEPEPRAPARTSTSCCQLPGDPT
jgi:hypothetical protein